MGANSVNSTMHGANTNNNMPSNNKINTDNNMTDIYPSNELNENGSVITLSESEIELNESQSPTAIPHDYRINESERSESETTEFTEITDSKESLSNRESPTSLLLSDYTLSDGTSNESESEIISNDYPLINKSKISKSEPCSNDCTPIKLQSESSTASDISPSSDSILNESVSEIKPATYDDTLSENEYEYESNIESKESVSDTAQLILSEIESISTEAKYIFVHIKVQLYHILHLNNAQKTLTIVNHTHSNRTHSNQLS